MTEYNRFCVSDMKKMCRACLRVADEAFQMTTVELEIYQSFIVKVASLDLDMNICLVCKWLLKKCVRFMQQCREANDILNETANVDTKLHLQVHPVCDLTISSLEDHYLGPALDTNGAKEEFVPLDDKLDEDDDDEIPLVMLQDDYKNKRRKSENYENNSELDIKELKEELDIKGKYSQDSYTKVKGRKKKKKKEKEIREGFSSRMVQETDEYIVIKLTKEQVMSELSEKAKTESYLRYPYKCDKCVKGFNFEEVLQSHMEKHSLDHGTYHCDICSQYCPSTVSLRGHLKSHTTRYKCKLCGQVRLSRQHLLEHYAITHTAAHSTYTCENCQFTTNKRTVIQRHVKTHTSNQSHACHRCGKLFTTVESLRVHTVRHDKSKRLQCDQCEKSFIYPSLLHKHIQAVHERKEYYCVECDVRFKSPESLRLHFKKAKKHRTNGSHKFPCPHCPSRFHGGSALAAHVCSVHGASREHTCALCRRSYSSRAALRAHVWRLHKQLHGNKRTKKKLPEAPQTQTDALV